MNFQPSKPLTLSPNKGEITTQRLAHGVSLAEVSALQARIAVKEIRVVVAVGSGLPENKNGEIATI